MQAEQLKLEEKRALCRFLEEALCNVGRYAADLTRLEVTCLTAEKENIILVEDNGKSTLDVPSKELKLTGGRGTKQANQLARRLKGRFSRTARSPTGVCCELRWPTD